MAKGLVDVVFSKPWSFTFVMLTDLGLSAERIDLYRRSYKRNYLRSQRYSDLTTRVAVRAKYRCEICKVKQSDGYVMSVDHKTWERMGAEDLDDVQLLCYKCQGQAHYDRRIKDATE